MCSKRRCYELSTYIPSYISYVQTSSKCVWTKYSFQHYSFLQLHIVNLWINFFTQELVDSGCVLQDSNVPLWEKRVIRFSQMELSDHSRPSSIRCHFLMRDPMTILFFIQVIVFAALLSLNWVNHIFMIYIIINTHSFSYSSVTSSDMSILSSCLLIEYRKLLLQRRWIKLSWRIIRLNFMLLCSSQWEYSSFP